MGESLRITYHYPMYIGYKKRWELIECLISFSCRKSKYKLRLKRNVDRFFRDLWLILKDAYDYELITTNYDKIIEKVTRDKLRTIGATNLWSIMKNEYKRSPNLYLLLFLRILEDFGLIHVLPNNYFAPLYVGSLKKYQIVRKTKLGSIVFSNLKDEDIPAEHKAVLALYAGLFCKTPARVVTWSIFSGCTTRKDLYISLLHLAGRKEIALSVNFLLQSLSQVDVYREESRIQIPDVKSVSSLESLIYTLGTINIIKFNSEYLTPFSPQLELRQEPELYWMLNAPKLLKFDMKINLEDPFEIYVTVDLLDLSKKIAIEETKYNEILLKIIDSISENIHQINIDLQRVHGYP